MSPILYLLPAGLAQPDSQWPCALVHGHELKPIGLADAADQLAGQAVDVRLPVELFSCWLSAPWPGRRRPTLQALGYGIEEQLCVPLDNLHLVAGRADAQRRYPLRACDAERWGEVMQVLRSAGVQLKALHIDADLLPDTGPCGLWLCGRWLLGGALDTRLALSAQEFVALRPRLSADLQLLNEPQDDDAAAHQLLLPPSVQTVDLLAVSRASTRWPLRPAAAALVLLLALECGLNWASAWQHRRAALQVQAATAERLAKLLPQSLRTGSIREQLRALQSPTDTSPSTLAQRVTALGEALLGGRGAQVQRLEYYRAQGWKIYLDAPALSDIEQLRDRAAEKNLHLLLESATQVAGRTAAVLTIEDES